MTNDNPLDLDRLEHTLKGTLGMTNYGQAERDRDIVKTGALLSIARSLESNKVPDHWEALEGPSGAVLGWFDPQVARAIAQALGASQARQDGDEAPEALPVVEGALVVLTALAEQAEVMGDTTAVGVVVALGESEGSAYAWVDWRDDDSEPGKVWVSDLTVVGHADAETANLAGADLEPDGDIEVPDADDLARLNAEADMLGDPTEAGVTSDGTVIEPDDEPAAAPDPVVDDDDIDADFDTVVESTPPADGLAALRKGKGKGKSKG